MAFAHSTIRVRCASSSLDWVLNTRSPISGSIWSPVPRNSTRYRASASPMRPVWVSLRPSPSQSRNEPDLPSQLRFLRGGLEIGHVVFPKRQQLVCRPKSNTAWYSVSPGSATLPSALVRREGARRNGPARLGASTLVVVLAGQPPTSASLAAASERVSGSNASSATMLRKASAARASSTSASLAAASKRSSSSSRAWLYRLLFGEGCLHIRSSFLGRTSREMKPTLHMRLNCRNEAATPL